MPTIITHAVTAGILGKSVIAKKMSFRFWFYLCLCAMLPDIDVIGFPLGINYGDFLGHRGFTHSIFFAVCMGVLIATVFYRKHGLFNKTWFGWAGLYSLVIVSHGFFDALTNGGLGIAFFSPFDNGRYFLPFTPVQVSPIGIRGIFSTRGMSLFASELFWVVLPCSIFGIFIYRMRKKNKF